MRGRDGINQHFLFLALREVVGQLQQQAQGAVFDTIVVDTFRRLKVIKPPLSLVAQIEDVVIPVFGQMLNLLHKNVNLRHTRGLLLPRLISGEVDVSNSDMSVEAWQGVFS